MSMKYIREGGGEVNALCGNCGKSLTAILDDRSRMWFMVEFERFPVMVHCDKCGQATEFTIDKGTYSIVKQVTGWCRGGWLYAEKEAEKALNGMEKYNETD